MYVCAKKRSMLKKVLPGARRKSYTRTLRFCDRKPRTCTTLRRCNYAEGGRLESCARDPIGYRDGNNLYSYVGNQSLDRVDPHGLSGLDSPSQAVKKCFEKATPGLVIKCLDDLLGTGNPKLQKHAKLAKCVMLHRAYDKLNCAGCRGICSPQEAKRRMGCLATEIAARSAYLAARCDYVLNGSKIRGSKIAERGHRREVMEKMQALNVCNWKALGMRTR